MEWMLQLVDEVDDALGAVRHQALGLGAEIGTTLGAAAGIALIITATAMGADALVIASAVGLLGTASFLKMQGLLRG